MTTISNQWTTHTIKAFGGAPIGTFPMLKVAFGVFDARRREVGCAVYVEPSKTWSDATKANELDGKFSYSLETQRNGERFGASMGRSERFATVEEAQLAAEAAIERSRKAAAKKYGAAAAPAVVEAPAVEGLKIEVEIEDVSAEVSSSFACQRCGQPCNGRASINTGPRCYLCGKQMPEARPLGELISPLGELLDETSA